MDEKDWSKVQGDALTIASKLEDVAFANRRKAYDSIMSHVSKDMTAEDARKQLGLNVRIVAEEIAKLAVQLGGDAGILLCGMRPA